MIGIEQMHEWNEAGYIDTEFTSHTTDMFFAIDSETYGRGRVGVMYGINTYLGNRLAESGEGVDPNFDYWPSYMPPSE